MKNILVFLLAAVLCASFVGCGQMSKTLHCDNCGKEIRVSAKSDADEGWTVFCKECEAALGLDSVIEERS